jgi:hypothetical protein
MAPAKEVHSFCFVAVVSKSIDLLCVFLFYGNLLFFFRVCNLFYKLPEEKKKENKACYSILEVIYFWSFLFGQNTTPFLVE